MSKQLREEIEGSARTAQAHLDAAILRERADADAVRRIVDEDMRPAIADAKQNVQIVTEALAQHRVQAAEQLEQTQLQCGRHRDIARDAAAEVTITSTTAISLVRANLSCGCCRCALA